MAVNKFIYNGETKIDLTADTVTAEDLARGKTAHNKSGEVITGVKDDVVVERLNANANGTYNAETLHAYNPVVVDVQPNLGTKNVTENATYRAVDDNLDGYSQVEVDVPIPTLGTKSINENGTYDASSDNLDGYSSVTVNVPDKLSQLLQGTITYIKVKNGEFLPGGYEQMQWLYNELIFVSLNNNGHYFSSSTLRNAGKLKYANIGAPILLMTFSFAVTRSIKAIIITSSSVCSLQNTNAFGAQSAITTGVGFVYVPDSLKTDYQTATNWTTYATQIKGFSEAPTYDNSTTYEIGDVCKYNGKFYGYCKEDLTSSTGNAPSGTTDDNDYWEYVADIEVA